MNKSELVTFTGVEWPDDMPQQLFRCSSVALHECVHVGFEVECERLVETENHFFHSDWTADNPWALLAFPIESTDGMRALLAGLVETEEFELVGFTSTGEPQFRSLGTVTSFGLSLADFPQNYVVN